MGFGAMFRSGNLRKKLNLTMVYVGTVITGSGFSLLTTTTFPEIVDAIERKADYSQFVKEDINLHISGLFVFMTAGAQLLGVFLGSTLAGALSYTTAFVLIGVVLIIYAGIYAAVCGVGSESKPSLT